MTFAVPSTALKEIAFADLDREIDITRRVLERLPEKNFAWKLHEKSMSLGRLAMHVATLLQWFLDTLQKDEFDLGAPIDMPRDADNRDHLLRVFDENAVKVRDAMRQISDAELTKKWTLWQGDQVLFTQTRAIVLRMWCLSHLIHHRAQLCVHLRLLNEPVPIVYFNSADEPDWTFT